MSDSKQLPEEKPLLTVDALTIDFLQDRGRVLRAAEDVSFRVDRESTTALVGESGSGKTVSALAVMGLLPKRQAIISPASRLVFDGISLRDLDARQWQSVRGSRISMIFQDPMSSLNPVLTIGYQLMEMLLLHRKLSKSEAREKAIDMLREVGIQEPAKRMRSYPHELSGGQQQRAMIAMALACEPDLLIADEPTTALDVTIQRQILTLLAELRSRRRMSMLFITHDLSLVHEIADQVVVMQHSKVRETGPVRRIFAAPEHPYTQALLACRPSLERPVDRLVTIDDWLSGNGAPMAVRAPAPVAAPEIGQQPLLRATHLRKVFTQRTGLMRSEPFVAVDDVSFDLFKGKTVGIVGESGSGKTTVGLTLLRLHEASAGQVWFEGKNLLDMRSAEFQAYKRRIQIVFQNPYASLNPRFTVEQILTEPMLLHGVGGNASERGQMALTLLDKVGLPSSALRRYPFEFSGGQRQRIAIARALALSPEVMVLDESVSALDVSVQAQILNLLKDIQKDLSLSYLFISHDLAVVRHMADHLLVMQRGRVVEQGPTSAVYAAPAHAYTRELLASVARQPALAA